MSSRALRKLQKLKEQELQASHENKLGEDDEEGEEDEGPYQQSTKPSAFAFLETVNQAEGDEDDNEEPEDDPVSYDSTHAGIPTSTRKPKKKKRKAKVKQVEKTDVQLEQDGEDDVEKALADLAGTSKSSGEAVQQTQQDHEADANLQAACGAFSIDTYFLHPTNEMRKLFGKAAEMRSRPDGDGADLEGPGREHRRRTRQLMRPGGRGQAGGGLATLGRRKNIFIQGQETWPSSAGTGLGMEIVNKEPSGITEYRFTHNGAYQDAQRQFAICVESSDPERLIHHLANNPYHISTLLQVSEILRHDRDYTAAGSMLERALFSFGRAVHTTFSSAMAAGKARLDFRRPENREFWLAGWRYIRNLDQRGTRRTGYEWTKLLIGLNPVDDPYYLAASIDQNALRCGQGQDFLRISNLAYYTERWGNLPNIAFSRALTLHRQKLPEEAATSLKEAMSWYPWMVPRLFKELNISRVPQALWGSEPPNDMQALLTEYYVLTAGDLWKPAETIRFLTDTAESLKATDPLSLNPETQIPLDLARHLLLTENKDLISLIPRSITAHAGSSSDPVPPPDSIGPDIFSLSESGHFSRSDVGSRGLIASMMSYVTSRQQAQDGSDARREAETNAPSEMTEEEMRELVEALEARDEVAEGQRGGNVLLRLVDAFAGLRMRVMGQTPGGERQAYVESEESSLEDEEFDEALDHMGPAHDEGPRRQ